MKLFSLIKKSFLVHKWVKIKALFRLVLFIVILKLYWNFYLTQTDVSFEEDVSSLSNKKCLFHFTRFCIRKNTPIIYVVTPTSKNLVQKAELVRLSSTFLLVPYLHWIIVEDTAMKTNCIRNIVKRFHGDVTHLTVEIPENYSSFRLVFQRNKGIEWLTENVENGVVYFADGGNTYDIQLFEEMRHTRRMSVWPVGIVGDFYTEGPVLQDGKVVSWKNSGKIESDFKMDMASFAVNLRLFRDYPEVRFSFSERFQICHMMKGFGLDLSHLEAKANQSTKVLVWLTITEKPDLNMEEYNKVPANVVLNMEL